MNLPNFSINDYVELIYTEHIWKDVEREFEKDNYYNFNNKTFFLIVLLEGQACSMRIAVGQDQGLEPFANALQFFVSLKTGFNSITFNSSNFHLLRGEVDYNGINRIIFGGETENSIMQIYLYDEKGFCLFKNNNFIKMYNTQNIAFERFLHDNSGNKYELDMEKVSQITFLTQNKYQWKNDFISNFHQVALPVFDELRLEMTNRCAYRCFCCPREKMTRSVGTISIQDLKLIIDRVGIFEGLVGLHGYGEALLDIDLIEKISIIKKNWPNSIPNITSTLGVDVGKDYFCKLIKAGLKIINVSLYGYNKESYKLMHGIDKFELAKKNLLILSELQSEIPDMFKINVQLDNFGEIDLLPSLEIRNKEKNDFCKWLSAINISSIIEMKAHNFGDGRRYFKAENKLPCSIVWGNYRYILQVSWDLNVIPCCMDYNSNLILGNLKNQTIEEIFSSKQYVEFINAHWKSDLNSYPTCNKCEKEYNGLLEQREMVIVFTLDELCKQWKNKKFKTLLYGDQVFLKKIIAKSRLREFNIVEIVNIDSLSYINHSQDNMPEIILICSDNLTPTAYDEINKFKDSGVNIIHLYSTNIHSDLKLHADK